MLLYTCVCVFLSAYVRNYPQILKRLFEIFQRERDGRVLDNIGATVCRLIMANIEGVSLQQVSFSQVPC